MKEIPSPSDRAIVCGDFTAFSPEELFDYWTVPELVVTWWPKVAAVDPQVGGEYRFSWKDYYLFGKYTAFDRGRHLGFTWAWSHQPTDLGDPLQVDLYFMPLEEGTRLAIYHGPFTSGEADLAARQGIVEGWIHFGMLLAGIKEGAAD